MQTVVVKLGIHVETLLVDVRLLPHVVTVHVLVRLGLIDNTRVVVLIVLLLQVVDVQIGLQ